MYEDSYFFDIETPYENSDYFPSLVPDFFSIDTGNDDCVGTFLGESKEFELNHNNIEKKIENESIFPILNNSEKLLKAETKQSTKTLGKKRAHDKYCTDNLLRKLKTKLFEAVLNKINNALDSTLKNEKQSNKYSKGYVLLKLNQEVISAVAKSKNRYLFNSKLKDIFSETITKKVRSYENDHNKKIIEKIYRENKNERVKKILERTLLECLEQFRGSKNYDELNGLEKGYERFKNDLKYEEDNEDYIATFEAFINGFEDYLDRNMKKSKEKKE